MKIKRLISLLLAAVFALSAAVLQGSDRIGHTGAGGFGGQRTA